MREIAESAGSARLSPVESSGDPAHGAIARMMLHDAIDGFIRGDAALCRGVLTNDDIIDDLNRDAAQEAR